MSQVANKKAKWTRHLGTRFLAKTAALGLLTLTVAGCVVEPWPPPGPPTAAVPAPGYPPGYVQPCCYAYPEYPPYYYGAYGPSVGAYYGYNRGYRHYWR